MENNVHHDVYNADVCTRARRGKRRGRRKRKRSEWDKGWGEESSAREGRRESKRRDREEKKVTIRERKTTIKGEGKEGDTPMKEKVEKEEMKKEG